MRIKGNKPKGKKNDQKTKKAKKCTQFKSMTSLGLEPAPSKSPISGVRSLTTAPCSHGIIILLH